MSIYKRKDKNGKPSETWWIQYTDANGKRIQCSAGTTDKRKAQELHDKLKAESWAISKLGAKPTYTWQDAVVRWLTEQEHKKSIREDKNHLRWLDVHLHDKQLDKINKSVVDRVKLIKQQSGVSNSTVNRMLAVLRSILNRAKNEWEWLDVVPAIRLFPESSSRVRWLTHEEADFLLCQLPEHLAIMARFTLATGLRESNVVGLQWTQVDIDRCCAWVNAEQAKGKKAIAVPLNNDAMLIIRKLKLLRKNDIYVFTYEGKNVTRANTKAWRNALKRAGIDNFRWHDLRHTWASWHVQNGTPLHVLKELGGWADLTMVLRYAHLSSRHLSEYANNLSRCDKFTTGNKKGLDKTV